MYVWKGATKSLNRLQRVMRDVCVHRKDNIKIVKHSYFSTVCDIIYSSTLKLRTPNKQTNKKTPAKFLPYLIEL